MSWATPFLLGAHETQLVICHFIGHKRSKRHARRSGETWHSHCVVCQAPLVRVGPGDWKPLQSVPAAREQTKLLDEPVFDWSKGQDDSD